MKKLLLCAALLPLLPLLPVLISTFVSFLFRVSFPVHASGIIVVTGANSGIGLAAAQHLSSLGYTVFGGARSSQGLSSLPGNLIPLKLDVSVHADVVSAAETVASYSQSHNLPFVALVNNAGSMRVNALEFVSVPDVEALFRTNVFGALDVTQQFLPLLRKSKGRVVMVSSVAGFVTAPLYGVYSSSKHALEAISDALRREVQHLGVSVSVVQPAYVKTAIGQKVDFVERGASLVSTTGLREGATREVVEATYPHLYNEKALRHKENEVKLGSSTTAVTDEAIAHAITSQYPKTRYRVARAGGMPAEALSWVMWSLPDRVKDFVVARKG